MSRLSLGLSCKVALAAITGAVSAPVAAANISHARISDLDVITVSGDIEAADAEKFRRLSVAYNRAVVSLDSNGGMLIPALEIGKIIKISEHATVVTDGSVCTSACALIWVAGSTKFLSSKGRIGFHASYKDEAGRKVETGMGNALVGHYLGSLNLPEKAVVFATAASPEEILWLNTWNMSKAGIDFKQFPEAVETRTAQTYSPVVQQSSVALPPAPIQPAATTNAILRVGTEVPVRLLEQLTTKGKKLRVGHRFRLETSEPVMVQGVVVIPVGSPAVGEITDVRNKGMWGKSGHLGGRLLYVTVNGRQIRLSGAFDDKGVAGGVGAVAVSAMVFLPAGFFMTGTSAQIPSGTIIKGFVDEDVPLSLQAATPPPLAVGSGPAAMTVPTQPTKVQPVAPGVSVATPETKL